MKRLNRGQAMVEASIALPLFLLLILGVMDLGRAAFTYNGISNLAREASRFAMVEYSSDATSPCYWASFDDASCLTQVKNYAIGLHMVPNINSMDVAVDLLACQSTCQGSGYPVTVSMSTKFQPVATSLLGIGPFNISASSTDQFVQPPAGPATPVPTPTTVGLETAPSGVIVTPTLNCTSQCQEFSVSWTPPPNINAIGHYELEYGANGSYTYAGPEPASVNGTATTTTIVDLPNQVDAECIQVVAAYSDGATQTGVGSWYKTGTTPPTC